MQLWDTYPLWLCIYAVQVCKNIKRALLNSNLSKKTQCNFYSGVNNTTLFKCLCSCLYGVFPIQYNMAGLCSHPFDFTRLWMASKSGASLPLPYLDITMSAIYLRTTFCVCVLYLFFVFIFNSHFEKLITVESLMMTINMGTMFGCLVKESSLIKVKLGYQSENNPWELFG